MIVMAVVAVLIISGGMVWHVRRRHIRALPETPDVQFGEYFREHFGIDPKHAITERSEISRLIGIPKQKLAPQTRLAELVSGPLDSTRIGLTDLEFDLSALAKGARREDQILMPDTVAEVLRLRMKLKAGKP